MEAQRTGEGQASGSGPGLRRADAVVALALFAVGLALRLPLTPFGETVEESLDPILAALALRDQMHFETPPFLHFGYGRDLSWLPLVLGSPDGLLAVALRRALVQAWVAPLAYLAARRLAGSGPGSCVGAAGFALLLATSEDFLQTGISGHETYMAAEWGAAALLAAGWLGQAPRRAAGVLGACLAMAVMNHPLAVPTLLLLLLPAPGAPRRIAAGAAGVLLIPQFVRLADAFRGGLPPGLAPLASEPSLGRLGEVLHVFGAARNLEVAVLMGALPLAVVVLRRGPRARLAWLGCGVFVLALLEVVVSGSSQGWYWRPLAPVMTVVGGVAAARLLGPEGPRPRAALAVLAAGAACALAVSSVQRAGDAFDHRPPGLRYTGHVTALGHWLESRQDEGPWGVRAVAGARGSGRYQLTPLAVDRLVGGAPPGLVVAARHASAKSWLLHVEAEPERLPSFRAAVQTLEATPIAAGTTFLVLRFPDLAALDAATARLCDQESGALEFDPSRWYGLGAGPDRLASGCPGPTP